MRGLDAPPKNWWRRKPPKRERLCYRKKSDALRLFLDANYQTIESYGGAGYRQSCEEFDSINHRYSYGLKRKPCARSIAEAVWYALPGSGQGGGPPYCLDELDLETLNQTDPGLYHGGFRLPDSAEEAILSRDQERRWEEEAIDRGEIDGCHTTWRNGRGRFRTGRGLRRTRVRQCVCRDDRGRFKRCSASEACDEVPF